VKKVSLKRSDDADKKAEAKAWVEEKKLKRAEKKGHHQQHPHSHAHEPVEDGERDPESWSKDDGLGSGNKS